MFTGIVEQVGQLAEVKPMAGGFRVRIETPLAAETVPGDSIAVGGVCLTALVVANGEVHADIGPERRITTLGLTRAASGQSRTAAAGRCRLGGHSCSAMSTASAWSRRPGRRRCLAHHQLSAVAVGALHPQGQRTVDGVSSPWPASTSAASTSGHPTPASTRRSASCVRGPRQPRVRRARKYVAGDEIAGLPISPALRRLAWPRPRRSVRPPPARGGPPARPFAQFGGLLERRRRWRRHPPRRDGHRVDDEDRENEGDRPWRPRRSRPRSSTS
jgi:riboflavin synthase